MTDPAKIIEYAWEALGESHQRYTTAGMTMIGERSKDYLAAGSKFDAACHEHVPAILAELRQLREVVSRLPGILNDIDVDDDVSINCRAGAFLVEMCPSFKTISPHQFGSLLESLDWLRSDAGRAVVDAARKAAKP